MCRFEGAWAKVALNSSPDLTRTVVRTDSLYSRGFQRMNQIIRSRRSLYLVLFIFVTEKFFICLFISFYFESMKINLLFLFKINHNKSFLTLHLVVQYISHINIKISVYATEKGKHIPHSWFCFCFFFDSDSFCQTTTHFYS